MPLSSYKNIILHAGVHKTGSSYLQKTLSENSSAIQAYSIYYPEYITKNGATHAGNHSLAVLGYKREVNLETYLARFLNIHSRCETLLISAEELSRENTSSNFLDGIRSAAPNANFRAVIYLRRPDHLIESVYSESVKRTLHGDVSKASYQLDFRKTLEPFIEAFGRSNIVVRPYNREKWLNNSLGADFCRAIGQEKLWDQINPIEETINVSLSRSHTFLLSMLQNRAAKRHLLQLFDKKPFNIPEDKGKYFRSPEERRLLVERHRRVFVEIAEAFGLGNADEFFGLSNFDDDNWTPFVPYWRRLMAYMAALADDMAAG